MVEILNDNFTRAYEIEMFAIQEAANQRAIMEYATECVCLETGDYVRLGVLNESLVDSIKNIISKIANFLKNAFAKFRERLSELFTTDKKFLEKYKDVIMKNTFKAHPLTDIYKYQTKEVDDVFSALPKFEIKNIDSKFDQNTGKGEAYTEETFIKNEISGLSTKYPKITDVKELIQAILRGGEDAPDEYSMASLDKTDIYNFCYKYDNILNMINKNNSIIGENQRKIEAVVDKLKTDVDNMKFEGRYYSRVYDTFITEGIKKSPDQENKKIGGSHNNGSTNQSYVSAVDQNKVSSEKDNKDQADNIKNNVTKDNHSTNKSRVDYISEACKTFFQCTSTMTTTTLNEVMAMYKTFMKILRVHVRDYLGNESGVNDSVSSGVSSGSDSGESSQGEGNTPIDTNISKGDNSGNIQLSVYATGDASDQLNNSVTRVESVAAIDHIKDQNMQSIAKSPDFDKLINNRNDLIKLADAKYKGQAVTLSVDGNGGKFVLQNYKGKWVTGFITNPKQ